MNSSTKGNKLDEYKRIAESLNGSFSYEKDTILITIDKDKLRDLAETIYWKMNCYHRTCVGVDETLLNGFLALYHIFGDDRNGLNIVVKTITEPGNPVIPSISDIVPAANWCELETHDLVGIIFSKRELYRFVLPPYWPKDIYPLRKNIPYNYKPDVVVSSERVGESGEAAVIPIGPYHPALHEPEYFELYVEGEKIIDVKYRGFHVHRGIEKLGESRMTYQQINFLAERICGICGFVHAVCYSQAVEKAADIYVPERAKFIRSIVLEIERLHSHLLWIGVAAHVLGYDTGFMHSWRIRESIMYIAEMLTGSRKTYGINLIGGVRRDIDENKVRKVFETLDIIERDFKKLIDTIKNVPEIVRRLKETGILPREDARKLSVVGPVARASGLDRDIRRDIPYAAYEHVDFKIPLYDTGDNLARFQVRVDEVFESMSIIKQLLSNLPKGPVINEEFEIPEYRIGVSLVEAPRGEDIHFVVTGRGKPYRWRVRAPTYNNIPALKVMLQGSTLADAPLTIASIDPCFSCTDRVYVIDEKGSRKELSIKPFIKRCNL